MSRPNKNIISVSAKATLKNEGFLSKLSSTLQTRRLPPPEQLETKSSLQWHKTTEVKERIKTATGTIAVYTDMTEDEVEKIKESVSFIPTLEEAQSSENLEPDVASTVIAEAASIAVQQSFGELTKTSTIYIALEDYVPDTTDGLPLISGQKVELLEMSSNKRPRLEGQDGAQLLDNSAAKHKMAIRPKKNHPDPRAKVAHEPREERWLVRDFETGNEGMVPSNLLGLAPPHTIFASSIKRSLQELSSEESKEIKRKLTKEMREIKSSKIRKSSSRQLLGPSPEDEARAKRAATIRELIETEEEFVKDLEYVVKNYYDIFDLPSTPKRIKDQKEVIFGTFDKIAEFHQNVLIEGVKYHADVPSLIGKTFLRLERDFDLHSEYCSNEPLADQFLETNSDVKEFFEEFSEKIGDDKRVQEHLKLPIQRLNDYQLLLKEIIRFSNRLGDETADLERAYDLMQTIPQRATDAKFLASIEGYKGNLFKLGRLIRHDWFSVSEVGHKTRDRYLFLFKARILITKVKRIAEDRSIFVLRDIIRLPETSLCGLERPRILEFHHIEPQNHPNFPITLEARNQETRDAWLEIVREHVIDTASVDDLLFDDEIRVISEEFEEQGHISPVAEAEDIIEDLPEDLEEDQVVPEVKEEDFVQREEQTSELIKQSEDLLLIDQQEESLIPSNLEQTSKRSLEKEESEELENTESSPPSKRRTSRHKTEEPKSIKEETPPPKPEPVIKDLESENLLQEESGPILESTKEPEYLEEQLFPKEDTEIQEVSTEIRNTEIEAFEKESELRHFEVETKSTEEILQEPEPIIPCEQIQEPHIEAPIIEEQKLQETKDSSEPSVKRPVEEEEEKGEDLFDFWGTRESSPPLKRRVPSPPVKEVSPQAVSDTKEEDKQFEQVEITAVKAEEPLAEQSEEFKLDIREDHPETEVPPAQSELVPEEKHQEIFEEKLETLPIDTEKKRESKKRPSDSKDKDFKRKQSSNTEPEAEVVKPQLDEDTFQQKFPKDEPLFEQVKETEPLLKEEEKVEKKKDSKKRPSDSKDKETKRKQSGKTEPESEVKPQLEEGAFQQKVPKEEPLSTLLETSFQEEQERKTEPILKQEKEEVVKVQEPEKKKNERKSSNKKELEKNETEKKSISKKLKTEDEVKIETPERKVSETKSETQGIIQKKEENKERGNKESEKESIKKKEEKGEIKEKMAVEPSQAPGTGTKPVFTRSISGDVVEPSDNATFVCEVEHVSQYYVTWLKDNKVLDDKLADRIVQQDEGKRHTLKLLHCKVEDSAIYTAKATDNNGVSSTCSAQLLVQKLTPEEREKKIADKKPFFLVKMLPTEVIENTKLSYAVHVKGDPMPKVTFYKDGKTLAEDDRVKIRKDAEHGKYEILIVHVQMGDAGSYKCVAMNRFGTAECEAAMTVAEEQKALENLGGKGSLLQPGEKADFKWFRDGIEFDPVERFNVMFRDEEDTLALVFQNVTPDDAGIYTCVASTSCGKISCSAELTVEGSVKRLMKDPEPPKFEEELGDNYVAMAGTAMLECKITGYPKPELTWKHDGKEVKMGGRIKQLWEDDENVTLIIKNITEADKGAYSVSAKNELGEAVASGKLIIRSPPRFRKIDKLVGCNIGKPMNCVVEVDGEPLPELKWMKDGKEIIPDNHIKFEHTPDGKFTMKIDKVGPEDCGNYAIVATNDMGQRAEQFEIQAETPPEITRGLDTETEKKAGNDQAFEVRGHGTPTPEATWYKDGKALPEESDKYKVTRDGQFYMLIIKDVGRRDRGNYKIVLKNRNGTAQSEGSLAVRGPPELVKHLDDACAKEGAKDIKLNIEWDSNPRPTVKWYFKDKEIHEDTEGYTIKTSENGSVLTIKLASEEAVGKYSIKLSNEYGDISDNAKFRLHEAPKIIEGLMDVEFLEDTKCIYKLQVSGVPIPDIRWTKDGKKWSADEQRVITKKEGEEIYMLVFDQAKTEDSGKYSAVLSNVEGSVTTEGSIIVNTPPHILRSNFRDGITFIAMHKLVLEVEATAVPEAEATWYCNGKELKEEEDSVKFSFDGKVYRMERIGSDPEQSGEYKCKLKNKIKEVEEKGTVTIIEKESRVRQPLKNVNVKEKTEGKIQCQIVGDPIPTVQWLRNGKPITDERIVITEDKEKRMHYLTFKNVEEEDKSTFTVIGKNQHGECETSCVMTIFVVPRPGELQDTVVDFGRDLLLSVHIHAIPPPHMTWFKNGKQLDESDRVTYIRDEKAEIYSLEIKSVVLEDDATYSYKAKNDVGEASGKSLVKIHTEKPSIITHIQDQEICLEDEVTFKVKVAGLPPPDVEWKNKNVIVNKSERYTTDQPEKEIHTITLKDLVMEDYGTITAIARNLVGEAPSTAELKQKTLPCEVLRGLDNVTKGAEGDDVTLSVLIRGSPRPKIVWTKDGDVVEASANIKISVKKKNYCEATISLTIVDATPASTGQYRLRFYNEVNEATTETALIVQRERRKPNIKNPPDDISVIEMDPVVVKVKVVGYPKPEVKWLKDGRVVRPTDILSAGIAANNEYVLEFKNVTLEDAGRYTLVATNEEGVTESEFYLAVEPAPSKPKFIEGLKATNVIAGYPARFEVQLGGHPKPSLAWLKDGKPIDIDGKHIQEIVTDDGRVILQIDNATDGDAGEYSVVAKNDFGENTSKAPLSVLDHDRKDGQDGPATFSEGLKDGTFDEGKTIRLPVGVRGGPKVPDMKWYKDGQEIKLGDRVFFTYDGDKAYLEIHPCSGSDSGRYKCVIENPNGQEETECDVTVRKCFESPSFTYTFPNQQKLPGEDAKFSVKVDGVPKPELSWFFNGKPIVPDGEKYRIRKEPDGSTLFVKDATYSDTGSYKVIAKNKEGQSEHSAELTVADDVDANRKFEAPNILKAIGDQELYESYTAKFKAVVSGRPEPEFEWFRNGMKLYPSNRILIERDEDGILRLSIKYVCEEDSGIYELKVWNDYGKASCRGKLICECISKQKKRPVGDEYKGFEKVRVSGVPIPLPDKPIISALSDRRCTLSWNPHIPAGPTTPVTYQVEYCECPEGEWSTARTGIRGNSVDITGLNPKSDYKFRVRVENKFGVSEPSPYVNTLRNRLEREPISHEPYIPTGGGSDYIDGPFVPSGFRIDRGPQGNFFAPPRFMKLDHDTQYGKKNFYGHVKWVVFGYPTPKLKFYYKDEEISFGVNSKYTYKQEENGETFLFIERLTEDDVGWYKCEAYNEYGQSQQRIRLGLSEYPRVLQHLKETYIRAQTSGRIYCRISAFPPCDVKWFKDWQEITPSMKMRPQYLEPDMYCLNFNGLSARDAGLYSIAAVNVAGAVSSSCSVHVIEDEHDFNWLGYARGKHVGINTRRGTLEDHYDIGDELGRGTQGVTYHCVERHTGNNFAAKSMWGKDQFKTWMHMEYDMMNLVNSSKRIVRLYDAYEGYKNMVLVMDLCSGGELLQTLTQRQYITEYEVAHFIRQILEGLDYMHDRWIAHLGLNIGDILLTRPNSTDIKLGDLSLARNIRLNKLQPLEYGMPEYVAPEVVKGENVSYPADMWAVGIIAYILLSGTSPFRGEHDRETLTRIQKGELRFDVEAFANLSEEAKDFVGKLLQYKPENRLDVKSALNHPWMKFAEMTPHDPYKISTERLRIYYSKYREWYANASCRRWYRRRPLASAFTHPSKMVYPPFEVYTPPESPEREVVPAKPEDFSIPYRDLSYEIGLIRNDSRYQQGPDTYLLQLRDTEFPVRLRKYMNLARERSPIAMFTGRDTSYDYERIPVVHERRRFTDIMDEEIEDERRRTMIDKYTSGFIRSKQATCSLDLPKRVKQEITSRYTIREEAEAIKMEDKQKGKIPFIREKPNTTAITPDMTLTLTCVVTGDPEPIVQWFRNDIILGDTARMAITCKDGRSQLYISQCTDFDVGFYKVVARNGNGQATHRFRLVRGEIPGMCDPPELEKVSGTQALLKWRTPIEDGGAAIEKYNLQKKPVGEIEWTSVNDNIPQEIYLVENLNPLTAYQFRVAAKNIRGWGEFSVSTPAVRTGNKDDARIEMPVEQELQQKNPKLQVLQLPGARGEIRDLLDYGRETQHVLIKDGEGALLQMKKYKMAYEISRGRFSSVMRCIRHDDQRTFACKIFLRREREEAVNREYQIAKSLRHERLATMYEVYSLPEVTTFIIEFLGGPDILTFLSNKLQYTEQNVSVVINQVLDAISYLHWRGICHLDLQPDNVVVTSPNKVDVKLVDFGSAQQVARTGSPVEINGLLDYISPEVMFERKAYPNSDVWSVGVLTYVLLTGTSPFVGISEEETMANIQCVRFKFETLGELLSQEATRFILLIFKRDPNKRPTEEECKDHKWLGENDFMVRKRERSVLSTTRLREYSTEYHKDRQRQVTSSKVFDSFKQDC